MSTITILAQTFFAGGYQYGGSTATIRIYATKPFIAADGSAIPAGAVGTSAFYKSVACTVASNTLTCPSFTLPSTTDALDDQTARFTFVLYDHRGTKREILFANIKGGQLSIPSNLGLALTFAQIAISNQSAQPLRDTSVYTKGEANTQIALALANAGCPNCTANYVPDWTGSVFESSTIAVSSPFTVNGATRRSTIIGSPNHASNLRPGQLGYVLTLVNDRNNEGSADNFPMVSYQSYGDLGSPSHHYHRYRGSESSPQALLAGDFFQSMGYRGWDGSGTVSSSMAAFQVLTTEDWTASAKGLRFQFQATPNGSTVRKHILEIRGNGAVFTRNSAVPGYAPYRTDDFHIVLDGTTAGGVTGFQQLIACEAATVAGIIMGESAANESYWARYGTAVAGNWTGTSIAVAGSTHIRAGANSDKPFYLSGFPIYNVAGNGSSNIGYRIDATGMRLDTAGNLHNAARALLDVNGDAIFAGNVSAASFQIANPTWTNLTLQNSWVTAGGSYPVPAYTKIGGVVYIRGVIISGTATDATVIFNLPADYRPAAQILRKVLSSTNVEARVLIAPGGDVQIFSCSASGVNLFDMSGFPAEA